MADTPTREELHAALREVAVKLFPNGDRLCNCCLRYWSSRHESHAPGCLAAPDALKGDGHE